MTVTKTLINTWKEEWQEFFDEALDKTWRTEELSPEGIKNRLKMLKYANENIEIIFSKFDGMQTVFSDLSQSAHVLHQFLDNDYHDYEYQSLSFEITVNEHIQFCFEPLDSTDATMELECKIEFENDYLSFITDEHDPKELRISMK
ncbi:hypothetical protein [Peribacillus sp. NPDC060253]|uniref:hypothetical protein n=1 Tax=Peribacillus sp. NPDC060253 TaxID=3347084 RepID=UPI003648C3B9